MASILLTSLHFMVSITWIFLLCQQSCQDSLSANQGASSVWRHTFWLSVHAYKHMNLLDKGTVVLGRGALLSQNNIIIKRYLFLSPFCWPASIRNIVWFIFILAVDWCWRHHRQNSTPFDSQSQQLISRLCIWKWNSTHKTLKSLRRRSTQIAAPS